MTVTSREVETIQRKCSTSIEESKVVWKERPLQVSLANQEVEYDLIAQEVESAEYCHGSKGPWLEVSFPKFLSQVSHDHVTSSGQCSRDAFKSH